jgi:hypothetical protein
MPKHPRRQSRTAKAAKAVQRAIRKDNPAKEPPTVGKPVIIDPAVPDPGERKRQRKQNKES